MGSGPLAGTGLGQELGWGQRAHMLTGRRPLSLGGWRVGGGGWCGAPETLGALEMSSTLTFQELPPPLLCANGRARLLSEIHGALDKGQEACAEEAPVGLWNGVWSFLLTECNKLQTFETSF